MWAEEGEPENETTYLLFHLLEWCCRFIPPDYPRADKPQHHDKMWNKMFIIVDWSLLGNLRTREGGAVKFFQIRQATLASARVKLGETVPRDFVEDRRRGMISWENSYSKKLPALTSLCTLVELRSYAYGRSGSHGSGEAARDYGETR